MIRDNQLRVWGLKNQDKLTLSTGNHTRTPSQAKSIKRHFTKKLSLYVALTFLQSFAVWSSSDQNSQLLNLTENKRIEASICADAMNRIAVANDRITQIFGDEGAFESQNDEATGQIFLKPTAENGTKSLSLTLITEQGITQDLTLTPTAKSAKTIILSRDSMGRDPQGGDSLSHGPLNQDSLNQDYESYNPISQNSHKHMHKQTNPYSRTNYSEPHLYLAKTLSIQEELLILLKHVITGQLPVNDEETVSRQHSPLEGYSLTPSQSWHAGPYVVHTLTVENVTETPLELHEKDFYQPGDLALSFDTRGTRQRVLAAQGKVTLYVVCHKQMGLS